MKFLLTLLCLLPFLAGASPEAEGFYAEYLATKDVRKLDAALALDPANETYRFAAVQWRQQSGLGTMEEIRSAIDMTRRFVRDYPETRHWVWGMALPSALNRHRTREADELLALVRDEYRKECRKLMKIDPEKPFRVPEDIRRYDLFAGYICRSYYFRGSSDPAFLRFRKELYYDFLRRINDFVETHPEDAEKVEQIKPSIDVLHMEMSGSIRERLSDAQEKVLAEYYLSLGEFAAEAERSRLPFIRFEALKISTIRSLVNAGNSEQEIRRIFFDYFAALDQEFPGFTRGRRGTFSSWTYINDLLRYHSLNYWAQKRLEKDGNYGCGLLAEYLKQQEQTPSAGSIDALMVALREKDDLSIREELQTAIPQIRSSGLHFLLDRNSCCLFSSFIHSLYGNGSTVSPGTRAWVLNELNRPFRHREIRTGRILAAEQSGREIHLICADGATLRLCRLDAENETLSALSEFPAEDSDIYTYAQPPEKNRFLASTPESFIFAGPNCLWVGTRENKIRWTRIKDLPPQLKPTGLAVSGGRIFLLGSGNLSGSREDKMLLSLDRDGGNRKLHFATARYEQTNPLDARKQGVATGLFAYGDEELLFAFFTERHTELWRFRLPDGLFLRIADLPGSSNCLMDYRNGMAWFSIGGFGDSIYRVNPAGGEVEHFFHGTGRINDGLTPRIELPGDRETRGPFLVSGNRLWLGGSMPFCVNLETPRETRILALPKSTDLFEYRGKIFFIAFDAVHLLEPEKPVP